MSVSVFSRNKVGTADELTLVATKNNQRVYVGTKKAVEAAMKNGDIGNGTVVYITDDYDDKTVIDTANYAVTAGTANTANKADIANKVDAKRFDNANTIPLISGDFWCNGDTSVQNVPKPGYVHFIHQIILATNDQYMSQHAIVSDEKASEYVREKTGGTWSEWKRVLSNSSGWDFYGGKKLPEKCDMKTIITPGTYFNNAGSTNPIDFPNGASGSGVLKVYYSDGFLVPNEITQEWSDYANPDKIARRLTKDGGKTWTHWFAFEGIDLGQ